MILNFTGLDVCAQAELSALLTLSSFLSFFQCNRYFAKKQMNMKIDPLHYTIKSHKMRKLVFKAIREMVPRHVFSLH